MKTLAEAPHANTAQPEQSLSDLNVSAEAREFGDCQACLLPVVEHFLGPHCSGPNVGCRGARSASAIFDRHLAKALGLGLTQFYKRKRAGDFHAFEIVPQLPHSNTRYSGVKVQRWLDGLPIDDVPARRFFTKAHAPTVVIARDREKRTSRVGKIGIGTGGAR